MLEQTDAITNEVPDPIMFFLAYPTLCGIQTPSSLRFRADFTKIFNEFITKLQGLPRYLR